eukprot:TRINITY_DN3515_c0_g1_i5.p1 TRINITY_DN3515_c0_g1~~TRINITY_DN3515_c0_g1_i5.p1  ORF type:complete len:294 (-),score=64.73 TRINITY_DN3515_c0_g1_i5:240-1121(-)
MNDSCDQFCLTTASSEMVKSLLDENFILIGSKPPNPVQDQSLGDVVADICIAIDERLIVINTIRGNMPAHEFTIEAFHAVENFDILLQELRQAQVDSIQNAMEDTFSSNYDVGYADEDIIEFLQSQSDADIAESSVAHRQEHMNEEWPSQDQDILLQQDIEYAEMLLRDEENERIRLEQEEQERKLKEELDRIDQEKERQRLRLQELFKDEPSETADCFTFRITFPDSTVKTRRFLASDPQQVLYLFAQSFSSDLCDIQIVTSDRRVLLSNDDTTLSKLELPRKCALRIQKLD